MENTAFGVALLVYLALALAALAMIQRQYKESGRLSREGAGLLLATFAADAVLRIASAWMLQPEGIANLMHPWALGVMLAGTALAAAAAKEFGSAPKVLCLDAGDLTRTGLYRYSRNPQIAGYLIALLGFSVAWGDQRGLVLLLVTGLFAHAWVLIEEKHLARVFGDDYAAYCGQVGRYF